ncbi:amidohydrolase family protein [Nocardioides piscis]|uniref:Amidohydrolase n=1 Tax=Nocardioides piscis TaxID=2714938 RepID=A0A6G7YDB7_9ACTN|nr:amidohydrolase family protein [Nocardioides piscis]QIK74719.1 amidohydrolase [Nocardioides piscis]
MSALPADSLPSLIPAAPYRIDVHCHHIPDFYRLSLAEHGIVTAGGIPVPAWTPEYALAFMTEYGIQTQVVSLSEPGVGYLPAAAERLSMARKVNDYTRDTLIGGSALLKDRFGGFAVLPLGRSLSRADVRNAADEARRAVTHLGMEGVGLFSSYGPHYLGDPRLEPLMRTLNELGALVFVHPVTPPNFPDLRLPTFLYEFPFDTTRAAVSMAYRQVYTRWPRIRWIFAHAGGTLPFVATRARDLQRRRGLAPTLFRRRFDGRNLDFSTHYYDTALSPARSAVQAAVRVAPRSHLLFATDWPFAGPVFVVPGDPAPQLSESFDARQRREVERGNALTLMPRLTRRLENS